jgi:3-hydroxyisobutyrate dehydrogenase-like beta-hydroxyacid dehydrogenase
MDTKRPLDRVAVIGLGSMGSRIAQRVGAVVSDLRLYDPVESRRRSVAEETAGTGYDSAAAAAAGAEAVVLVVADARQAEEALFGHDGVLDGLMPGAVVVVMSTIGPSAVASIAARVTDAGCGVVDAPMTGGTALAGRGELLLFVSGRSLDIEAVAPVLESCSRQWYPAGEEPGSGQIVKLVNQLLCSVHMMAAAEALAFARALGLDQHQAFNVLREGAGASFILDHYGERMIDGPYQPPSSALTILLKDSGLVLAEATERGLPAPAIQAAHDLLQRGVEQGYEADDITGIIRVYNQEVEGA